MTENLRKPTEGEAAPIISQPKMAIVKEEGETAAETEATAEAAAEIEQPVEQEEPVVKPKRKRRGRKPKLVIPNQLSLTNLEMMALDLNQARVDMQATVLQNLKMKETILNAEYVQQRDGLRIKQRDTIQSMERCKEEYNQTREKIEKRLGISLNKCTVRQDGVVIQIDEQGNPEYMGEGE
jgi:hypothetical protein